MSRNYRSPSPAVWENFQDANNQPGCGNFRNLRQYVDQASTAEGWDSNDIGNMYQEQHKRDDLPTVYRQWVTGNAATTGQLPTSNDETQTNTQANEDHDNVNLKRDLINQYKTLEYRAKLELRQKFPVMRQRGAVLQSLRLHQVVLIVGDNGCGKSSQVPQILLDDYILDCRGKDCNIICAELTKMEAMALAERVACERNERLGTSVGFLVRGESCLPRSSGSILYCTNSILLKQLRQDYLLKKFSVCILDNTHQPNSYAIQIMELLKLILRHRQDFQIILLSNNVLEDTFCEYFSDYHVFFVQSANSAVDLTEEDAYAECPSSSDEVASIDVPHVPSNNVGEQSKQQNVKLAFNNARAFVKKYRHMDPTLMTDKQRQMLRQHKQTIRYYKARYPRKEKCPRTQATGRNNNAERFDNNSSATTAAGVPIKRTISMDEAFGGARTTMLDDDDEDLQIAVMDMSDEHGRISRDKWLVVEEKLIFDMTNDNWSKDQISFDKVNWHKGIKVIACHNKRTLEFLKAAIEEAGRILPGVNLKVVPRSTLPTYATVWIPPPILPLEKILQLIKKQNVGLNTDNWKIMALQRCRKNFGKEYRLVMNGASIRHIRENQGKIKFGLGTIRVRIYGF